MPRHRKSVHEQELLRSAALIAAQCKPRAKKPSKQTLARKGHIESIVVRVEACIASNDWGDKEPSLLVGVFCWAHREVYGVDVIPELRRYYLAAVQGVKRLQCELNDSFDDTLTFLRWVWSRESDREEWRRKNTGYGRRISWHGVFVDRRLLTEYRLEQARRGGVR